ncbi:MAG: alpha/beta hydrolase [Anaerolineales bacterium]|nr:alpha/beta hydrolase [Anaerolineales bacterium]
MFESPQAQNHISTRSAAIIGAAVVGSLIWLAFRHWRTAMYYWRLFQAKRLADQFYAECPTVHRNVVYHSDMPKRLDVYCPPAAGAHPVVFYVYGGSWHSGNKVLYASAAQRLLSEGVVVVIPDYTVYPAAGYPRQSQEVAAALAWTLDHSHLYGGDPGRVFVAAQSAGAQIAALALLDRRFLAPYGHNPSEVRGFIGISGVYDIPTQLAHERRKGRSGQYVISVMGGRQNVTVASPLAHAGAHAPPALLIHGDVDGTVPVQMSLDLHARLRAAGVDCELAIYPGGGHSGILFDALRQKPSRLISDVMGFVRRATAPLASPPEPTA